MTPSEYKGTAPQEAQADPKEKAMAELNRTRPERAAEAAANARTGQLKPIDAAPVPQTEGECPDCAGDGRWGKPYDDVCPTCSGTGKEKA